MEKVPFILKELSIRKMPGLPSGLKSYKELSPNINIIAGPNASGKSSTARMIQQIIRRNNTERMQARSVVEIDRENWQVNIDSRHIKVQREGVDAQLTGLPPAETEGRYMLAFHELVNEEEQGLAKQILKESVGGFDLDQAMQDLNYSENITTTRASGYKKYQQAYKAYNDLLNQQKALKKEEEKLKQLYTEKENAEKAAKLKGFYELVKDWLSQKKEFENRRDHYKAYPEVMDRLNGEEYKNIEGLEKEIAEAQEAVEQAQKTIDRCKRELSNINLPAEGVDDKTLDELKKKIEQLDETGREIASKKQEKEAAQKKEEEALRAISSSLDYNSWKGINLKDVTSLRMFLDKATKTYSEKQFLETEIDKLKQDREKIEEAKPDTLKTGIKALSQWLQEQMSSGISGKWLWFLTIAGVLTAGVTFMFGWYGLLGIAVLVVLSVYASQNRSTNETTIRQDDYLNTGLEAPVEWNIEKVSETLNHLSEKLSRAWYKDKLDKKIEQRDEELENLQARFVEVETTHQEWIEKLKAAPDLPEADVKNYSGLYWFLVHAKEWQENHAEVEALNAQQEELDKNYADLLKEINEMFRQNNAEEAEDIAGAKAIFNKLYKDEEKRSKNTREVERQNEIIEKNKGIEQEKRQKLQGIYKKLDLNEGEKEQVRLLVEQLNDYKETKSNYQIKQSSLKEKETRMQEHSMYKEKQNEVVFLSPDEVEEQVQKYEQQALEQEKISKEIIEIETNIKNAKANNDLEDALKNKEQALSELEELYERNLSALTGSVLVEELKKETQNKNRTPVLKRANKIFNRITRGRYELQLTEENGKPVFKAFDTILNVGQHLDELSTGTRVQLLLSVRVAFVETQESALKLPVLADELLANSDDARAKAIIDALVEISRDGRQVFYFTAQGDEVAKWKHHMSSVNDISYEVFEISGESDENIDYEDYKPPYKTFKLKQTDIPEPSGKTYEAYGKELHVPSFDLLSQSVEKIHLWYLMEDSKLLYNCLSLGIRFWGQLQSFLENSGTIRGLDSDYIKKLKNKAALMERFQELYRQGRPVPIDRSVLEDSGAVSDNFIAAVSQKLEEVNRNPKQLIQALRRKEVPRFVKSKIDELEAFLFNKDYIREEEVLDKDEILVNLQAMISTMEVERGEVERMIELVMISAENDH